MVYYFYILILNIGANAAPYPAPTFFLFFAIQKERMLDKKEKLRTAAFFCRKMPVFLSSLKLSQNRGGRSLYLRACGKAAIVSLIDCAKHNPYDARRALKTLRVSLSLCVFLSLFIAKKRKKYTRLKIYLYTILCKMV